MHTISNDLPASASSREQLASQISDVFFTEALFDVMQDVVFFVKDNAGRYVVVNQTLVERCGQKNKRALLGRTASEMFPASLAVNYSEQDNFVLTGAGELRDQLELHLYPDRDPGWCLTHKMPVFDAHRKIIGLTGISRDLAMPDHRHPVYHKIAAALRHLHANYAEAIHMADLAHITNLSVAQIERYFQKIFSLTPRQMIIKIRLDAAAGMLADPDKSITDIAADCGYQDHSAFSRVFKSTVGVTPSDYRLMLQNQATHES
jgi:AraC-like DNA-binding protein